MKVTHLAVAAINCLTHKTFKTKQKLSNSMPMNRYTLGVIWTPKHRRRSFFFRVWRRLSMLKKNLFKNNLLSPPSDDGWYSAATPYRCLLCKSYYRPNGMWMVPIRVLRIRVRCVRFLFRLLANGHEKVSVTSILPS